MYRSTIGGVRLFVEEIAEPLLLKLKARNLDVLPVAALKVDVHHIVWLVCATPNSTASLLVCIVRLGVLQWGRPIMNATLAETVTAPASASVWPLYPSLYEINTWVWLSELSHRYGTEVSLCSVPPAEWDAVAAYGFDAVWLMGVWERSPHGIAIANRNPALLDDFRRALPGFRPEDNVGSA